MFLKKHIPNSLTLLNLLSGLLAILALFIGKLEYLPWLLALSLLADFLDGLVARALHVSSPIGKELDSLADMVSFGVLPGLLMLYLSARAYFHMQDTKEFLSIFENIHSFSEAFIIFFPLIISLFSALRLAKFNVATNQSKEFMGLATPAATLLVLGLFVNERNEFFESSFIYNSISLNIISIVIAILLISNLPMFSFKLGKFSWQEHKWQIIFVLSAIVLLIFFKLAALALIVLVYILINLLRKAIS
ncbi:MAG: CDP-alcohol phosphatidyltransferase family protein [Chitinophagales bacterium]|nr:CDP-alcohol phosphatidyltransferase family protein [Bacteroidota bacterium]MCB9257454.1 CDP-alcohol phosphatidyltransferase family protein [Chitinophagales bacterium]